MNLWQIKCNRFVAFFDILGFKEMVLKNSHDSIFTKLGILKNETEFLGRIDKGDFKEYEIDKDQTRSVLFSDSIIFFSRGDSIGDASKIIVDAYTIIMAAYKARIPIKGAVSFGEVSVDFDKSIFFGQPIIDSYLLHEDLKVLTAVFDHHSESKIDALNIHETLKNNLVDYKSQLSYGRVKHKLLGFGVQPDKYIQELNEFYKDTSGKPRTYLDNTMEYLLFLSERQNEKKK